MGRQSVFTRVASRVAKWCGSPVAVALALASIIAWAFAGPFFGFSDVWQLTINTGTSIITFLMVFIIQNSQNRDTEAVQIKLDELIRGNHLAHNSLLDLEKLDQRDLDKFRDHYAKLAEDAREDGIDIDAMLVAIQAERESAQAITERVSSKASKRKTSRRSRKPPASSKKEAGPQSAGS